MKVIAYTRVSTEEQATGGHSLAAQEARIRAFCDLYGLEIAAFATDAGISAKTLRRPGLQGALAALDRGEAEGLIVAKLDRLTRSVGDMSGLIGAYFAERFNLFSVADQVDTRSAGGRLVLNVLVSVAQWEREAIGERTREALAVVRRKGTRLGGEPLGTTPAEVETLARVAALRREGLTLAAIADRLRQEGRRTKKGGTWHPQTVANCLRLAAR